MKISFNTKLLKKITDYSVVLIPYDPSRSTRTIKLSLLKITILFILYSIIIFFAGFYIIHASSFGKFIAPASFFENADERTQLELLNEKILELASEVQKLKSTNKRLKNILLQQDSLNSIDEKNDKNKSSLQKNSGGNIYSVISDLFNKYFISQRSIVFLKPTDGYISRKFDPEGGHFGIDFATNENNPIFASASGYISFAGYTPEYGYTLVINHTDEFLTRYMHCSILIKKQGDKVQQGELIALAGNSGFKTTGPHLHFELWLKGKPVNPEDYLLNF